MAIRKFTQFDQLIGQKTMFFKSIHLTFILHIWIPYTLEEYILKRMLLITTMNVENSSKAVTSVISRSISYPPTAIVNLSIFNGHKLIISRRNECYFS